MKKRRYSIIDSNRWLKTKRSSIIDKCLRELFSEFPPIHFSIQPQILQHKYLWRNNIHDGAPARTKSCLPTTRCSRANQRLHLCHVIAATPSRNPSPPSKNIPNPYLQSSCLRASSWRNEYCTIPDPFDPKKKLMQFTNLVEIRRGEFYATSLQGALVEMQVVDTCLVTDVGAVRAVPSVPWRFFKEYMVEMNGEILLVFLIHEKSLAVVDHVEVFRLDLDKLRLVKVERLRGKTMFLKEKCVWVESAEFGCRDNCVFFTEGNENMWRMYDMKTCNISSV